MLIHPELNIIHEKSVNVSSYYWGKYQYLKKHNFFSTPKPVNFGTLTQSMIRENIVQTSQITFEVTDFCNLNCSYCSFGELYEGFDERNLKNIDIKSAIKLLKYIFDLQPKNKNKKLAIGFYGGEPLFNGNFITQIINITNKLKKEKEIEIEYNITTNATLIHKYIKLLVENNFRILISLDGNERNHSHRVFIKNNKNSYSKVIENIDMIQREYPEYFANYINFNAVLHNKNSVTDIYKFIYKRYNKVPRIAELSADDVRPDKIKAHSTIFKDKRESENEFIKKELGLQTVMHNESSLYKELTNFIKYYSINFYTGNIITLLHKVEKYLPTNSCLPGQKKILLTTNNKLLPCERVNYKYSIGEINENIVINIPEITKRYKFYFDHIEKVCQHCYTYRFCNVCMFHISKLEKVDTEDFACDYFHNSDDFKEKAHRLFSFLEKYPNDFFQITENIVIE